MVVDRLDGVIRTVRVGLGVVILVGNVRIVYKNLMDSSPVVLLLDTVSISVVVSIVIIDVCLARMVGMGFSPLLIIVNKGLDLLNIVVLKPSQDVFVDRGIV